MVLGRQAMQTLENFVVNVYVGAPKVKLSVAGASDHCANERNYIYEPE